MHPLWKHAATVGLGLLACGTPLYAQSSRIIDGRPNNDRSVDFLLDGASVWTMNTAAFLAKADPLGFEWSDASKTRARAAG